MEEGQLGFGTRCVYFSQSDYVCFPPVSVGVVVVVCPLFFILELSEAPKMC